MAEITRKELILALIACGTSEYPRLAGLDLSGLDLSMMNLYRADLKHSNLGTQLSP